MLVPKPLALVVASTFAALPGLAAAGAIDPNAPPPVVQFEVQGINPVTGGAINWSSAELPFVIDADTGDFRLAADYRGGSNGTLGDGRQFFSFEMLVGDNGGNVDPFMTYGFRVTNNTGAPITVTRNFRAPILPTVTLPNSVRATMSGGLTDATGNGVGIGLAPGFTSTQFFSLSPNNLPTVPNASYVNAGVDVGGAEFESGLGSGGSYVYGAYDSGYASGPLGTWNTMRLQTRFTLTGDGDVAVMTGFAEILPIPEPSEYAFMVAGLALAGLIARRRRAGGSLAA